jgi:glucosamine-6-phosphate deaminase
LTVDLVVWPDRTWADQAADRLVASAGTASTVCLATGATTTPLYAEVARRRGLQGVEVFLLDEFGGLPGDDPGRCRAMLQRDLLDLLDDPLPVHHPDVDDPDPAKAASEYGALVRSRQIDLAIVGLGANGHVGMNEPGSEASSMTRVVKLADETSANASRYGATNSPTWGITVGLSELLAARRLRMVVTGGHKSEILESCLTWPIGPDLPATFLRLHPDLAVFADESAAGRLEAGHVPMER